MITAASLKRMLQGIPDDTLIIMQVDDEGNGYRYVNGIDFADYQSENCNYFNGEEVVRKKDIEAGYGFSTMGASDGEHIVAVIF